ncbi:MAG: hypothetical protein ACXWCM_12505 [Acidimicrobiales bacterium]
MAVAAGLLGAMPLIASTASALPPVCQPQIATNGADSMASVCTPPPDPDPDPPPTTVPPPPVPDWNATVSVLDQSTNGFGRSVLGTWGRSDAPSRSLGGVTWTDPAQTEGTLTLAGNDLPVGGTIGFRLFEQGSPGPLCRSFPADAVAPTGRTARVLVAPLMTVTPDDLAAMGAGFAGRVQPDPADAQVTITSASIDARDGGLFLTLHGTIWKDVQFPLPNFDGTFTYTVMLHLIPSVSIVDPHEVMLAWADQGNLSVDGNGITDDVELWFIDDLEPQFRTAVVDKATSAVNDRVANDPQVSWFASLGYTVSVRTVAVTPNGVDVQPSLCKVS